MEALYMYLIRSSAGIVLFYLVYWIFLRKETFCTANRLFLMSTLILAVTLPLFPFRYPVIVEEAKASTQVFQAVTDAFRNKSEAPFYTFPENSDRTISTLLLTIYLIGTGIILSRLIWQTMTLAAIIRKNGTRRISGIQIVENRKYDHPFSFFHFTFINPEVHNQEIPGEILAHEKVHIHEAHWVDVILIELLTAMFWFNPFIWLYERSVKQNHEYLADQGVLAQGHHIGRYQALLINQAMGIQIIGITNQMSYAPGKNRLIMMTKKKTPRLGGLRFMGIIPVIALLIYAFSEPVYMAGAQEQAVINPEVHADQKTLTITGRVIRHDNGKPLSGASVIIKGTTKGTVAGDDGSYTLVDPDPSDQNNDGTLSTHLVVSYVGYTTAEYVVNSNEPSAGTANHTFQLKEGVIHIDASRFIKGELPPPPPPPSGEATSKIPPPPPPADNQGKTPPPPPPASKDKVPPPPPEPKKEVYRIVEAMPEYPGGFYVMGQFVTNMQDKLSRVDHVRGKASVGFTVNAQGEVTKIKVLEADNEQAGKAAASIVQSMPDWTPGMQHGNPVPVNYILPVEF